MPEIIDIRDSLINELSQQYGVDIEYVDGTFLGSLVNTLQWSIKRQYDNADQQVAQFDLESVLGGQLDILQAALGVRQQVRIYDQSETQQLSINDQIVLQTIDVMRYPNILSQTLVSGNGGYQSVEEIINDDIQIEDQAGNRFKLYFGDNDVEYWIQQFSRPVCIVPAQPVIMIPNRVIQKDTRFNIIQQKSKIAPQLIVKQQRSIDSIYYIESRRDFANRLFNTFQIANSFNQQSITQQLKYIEPQIQDVRVYDKIRGQGTVDIVMYPRLTEVTTDQDFQQVNDQFVGWVQREQLRYVPLGIDVRFICQQPVKVDVGIGFDIWDLNVPDMPQDEFDELMQTLGANVRTNLIDQLSQLEVDQPVTAAQVLDQFRKQVNDTTYNGISVYTLFGMTNEFLNSVQVVFLLNNTVASYDKFEQPAGGFVQINEILFSYSTGGGGVAI